MVYDPANKPVNPYAELWADFSKYTENHELRVILDDGMNRQIRMGEPGTGIYSWHIITWHGSLATHGDIASGYVFSRDIDMIRFFDIGSRKEGYYSDGSPSIDFRYWAEKLQGRNSRDIKVYSERVFLDYVKGRLEEHPEIGLEADKEHLKRIEITKAVCARQSIDYEEYLLVLRAGDDRWKLDEIPADVRRRVGDIKAIEIEGLDELEHFGEPIPEASPAERRQLILEDARDEAGDTDSAYRWLADNEEAIHDADTWEVDVTDYDSDFIIACYAIAKTVQAYREWEQTEAVQSERARKPYIVIEGGRVTNDPTLPVFDLDEMDAFTRDDAGAVDAIHLYERIAEEPKAAIDLLDVRLELVAFVHNYGQPAQIETIDKLETARMQLLAEDYLKEFERHYWRTSDDVMRLNELAAFIVEHGSEAQKKRLVSWQESLVVRRAQRAVDQYRDALRTKATEVDLEALASFIRETGTEGQIEQLEKLAQPVVAR